MKAAQTPATHALTWRVVAEVALSRRLLRIDPVPCEEVVALFRRLLVNIVFLHQGVERY